MMMGDHHHHHHVPGLLQTSAIMASSLSSVLLMSSLLGDSFLVTKLFRLSVYFVRCLPLPLVLKSFHSIFAFLVHQLWLNAKKIEVVLFWWFWVGIFCVRSFPLLLSFSSFQSMIFSLFFWCTTFQLGATIAKLYYKGNYILKERYESVWNIHWRKTIWFHNRQRLIYTIRYHQESSQRSWAFFPSKCIIFGCFSSFAFQACQEDDPCYQKNPTKKLSYYSFLEGKCHLDLYVALNFYANICLHHHIKGLKSKSAQKGKTKSFYSSSPLTSWDK